MFKVNRQEMYVLFFVCMILLVIFFYRLSTESNELNFSCSAHLEYVDEVSNALLSTNAIIVFRKDGKGMLTFDGGIVMRDKHYNLSRVLMFDYDYFGHGTYTLNNRKTIIHNKDTLPLNLFEDLYYSGSSFFVSSLNGIGNIKMIGTETTPVFMCVVQ